MRRSVASKCPVAIAFGVSIVMILASEMRRASASTTFTVVNIADSGPGSLRQAILDANATAGSDTINFDSSVTGTITLTTGQLPVISESLTIVGPGASVITVSGNHASGIFEIANGVIANISEVTISNAYHFEGGGIFNNGGTLSVSNSTLSDSSSSAGGGIANLGGTVTITNSTFSGNTASGGGIFNQRGTVAMIGCTISYNSGPGGGGIWNQGGVMTINNSTISTNSAGFFMGGAIFVDDGTVNLSSCTLWGNSGGGIRVIGGTVNIKNTILANSTGGDCSVASPGILNGLGVNFSTDGSCLGFTAVTAAQLNLGPLVVNPPGTTATHALLPGSVAIDGVTDCTDLAGNLVAQDQRGVTRPIDGNSDGIAQCDVGAYEEATTFDMCQQDDSNRNLLQINSTTGDYQFTNCSGFTLSGTGSLIKKSSIITLQHYAADRRVLARIDTSVNKGTASIQVFSQGTTFTIMDRNTANNTCACAVT